MSPPSAAGPGDEVAFHGELVAPGGLEEVARLVAVCSWPLTLRRSGFDGTAYLRAGGGPVTLDMDSGQGPRYLFSGSVEGDADDARRLLGELSSALASGGVVHRIEMYGAEGDAPLGYLHHGWPDGAASPVSS